MPTPTPPRWEDEGQQLKAIGSPVYIQPDDNKWRIMIAVQGKSYIMQTLDERANAISRANAYALAWQTLDAIVTYYDCPEPDRNAIFAKAVDMAWDVLRKKGGLPPRQTALTWYRRYINDCYRTLYTQDKNAWKSAVKNTLAEDVLAPDFVNILCLKLGTNGMYFDVAVAKSEYDDTKRLGIAESWVWERVYRLTGRLPLDIPHAFVHHEFDRLYELEKSRPIEADGQLSLF